MKKIFLLLLLLPVLSVAQPRRLQLNGAWILEYQAILNKGITSGYTLPSNEISGWGQTYIKDGKADGTWAGKDVLYNYSMDGDANFATINWKNPSANQIVIHGSPPWIKFQGFSGDGTAAYLDTNFKPSTGTNLTQNNAGTGVFINNALSTTIGTGATFGVSNAGVDGFSFSPMGTVNLTNYRVNQSVITQYTQSTRFGLWHLKRTSSTAISVFLQGASNHSDTQSSSGRVASNIYVLSGSNAGTPGSYWDQSTVGMFWAGSSLSGLENNEYTNWTKFQSHLLNKERDPVPPIHYTGRSNWIASGDSYTFGVGASPSSNSYINRFFANNSWITTSSNVAVSGTGVNDMAMTIQAQTFTGSNTIISVLGGLNNVRASGAVTAMVNKIGDSYRTIVLTGITNLRAASGSGGVTRSGSVVAFDASGSVGGRFPSGSLPGNFATSIADGNTGSWSWTFTDTQFGIQFIGSNGTPTYGQCTIKVDGTLVATVDLNVGGQGAIAYTYHGFTNASHTVLVEKVGTTGIVALDFFATLNSPSNSAAFVFFEIPYITNYGDVGGGSSTDKWSTAAGDQLSAVIKGVVTFYYNLGYAATFVPTNSFNEVNSGIDIDGLHWNNTGHGYGLNALQSKVVP